MLAQPELARRIAAMGHEIGCHGWSRDLLYTITPERFRAETQQALEAIRQVTGQDVLAYRSAYFSITRRSLRALDILNSALDWAAHWKEEAHSVALDVPGAEDLRIIVVDRATKERIWMAHFRVASRQAGVQVGGYPDTLETDFVLHILSEQMRKLRS